MCVTTEPSRMSNTILYGAHLTLDGGLFHVLGYQNKAQSKTPNAMLLPIPSAKPLGPVNVHDMTACPKLLEAYAEFLEPRYRGFSLGKGSNAPDSLQVFDAGSYTVVLATDPTQIMDALTRVPAHKRPRPNKDIFSAYAKWYPGWHVALCCYAGDIEAEPMVWSYEPLDADKLFLPGLDGHDGGVPNLKDADVSRDHSIAFHIEGRDHTYKMPSRVIPASHSGIFKPTFDGRSFKQQSVNSSPNGDFVIRTRTGKQAMRIEIAPPPGA